MDVAVAMTFFGLATALMKIHLCNKVERLSSFINKTSTSGGDTNEGDHVIHVFDTMLGDLGIDRY